VRARQFTAPPVRPRRRWRNARVAFRQAALDKVASFTAATAVELESCYRSASTASTAPWPGLGIASAIVLLTMLVVAWVMRHLPRRGVRAAAMDRIAAGDTSIEFLPQYLDEIGEMAKATRSLDNLSKLQLTEP
jgi:HAMP domain-containing protein